MKEAEAFLKNVEAYWLSPVFGVRYIPLQCPAIVCQHTWGPLALIPLFHSHNILVKSFTVFVIDLAEIFWEKKSKCDSRKWIFRIILHPISLYEVNRSCITSWYFDALWFPKKSFQIFLNGTMLFFQSFSSSSNCLSCISSLIWGPINTQSLIFASITFGNLFLTYSNPRQVLTKPFTMFFMRPSFMCKGGG